MSLVKVLASDTELASILKNGRLTVIDFTATWCGPCKAIAPHFDTLSNAHSGVNFVKVDVDKFPALAEEFGVTGMPTFVFVDGGQEVARVVGANLPLLKTKLADLTSF
jgi:thioredoxin 1